MNREEVAAGPGQGAAAGEDGADYTVATVQSSISKGFNYADLDAAVASRARTAAERIRKRTYDAYVENGRDLKVVRAMLGHGAFGPWLRAEFDMSERTAQNLMAASDLADSKSANISALPVTAVYRLAAPSTPESVRDEILGRVENGETLSIKTISAAIAEGKRREADAKAEQERQACRARMTPEDRRREKKNQESRKRRREQEEEQRRREEAEANAAADAIVTLPTDRLGSDLTTFQNPLAKAGAWRVQSRLARALS